MLIYRARRELEEVTSTPILALGRFTVSDPTALRNFAAFDARGAALGGLSRVTGEAVQHSLDLLAEPERPRPDMPHHVLVVVTRDAASAFASGHRHRVGAQAAGWEAGSFGAQLEAARIGEVRGRLTIAPVMVGAGRWWRAS